MKNKIDVSTEEKKYSSTKIKNICLECGNEYIGCDDTIFCSNECSDKFFKKQLKMIY